MNPIRAFIFDIGGTLYRPAHDICREFLIELGIETARSISYDELAGIMAESGRRWLDEYMVTHGVGQYWKPTTDIWIEYDRIFLSALGVRGNLDELAVEYQQKWDALFKNIELTLMDGCREVLQGLRASGYSLAVVSNRFDDPRPMLARDSIIDLFDVVDYSNVPGYRKPAPFMLLRAADKMGVPPETCVYVGNTVEDDVVAAQRAGMQPVLITWCEPNLQSSDIPDDVVVINHIRELMSITEEDFHEDTQSVL